MYYSISGRIKPEQCIRSMVTVEGNGIRIAVEPPEIEGICAANVTAEFSDPDYSVETAKTVLQEIIDTLLLILSMGYDQPCTFEIVSTSVSRQHEEREIAASSGQGTRTVVSGFSTAAGIVKGIEDESWLAALRCRDAVMDNPATRYVLGLYRKALEDQGNEALHLYKTIEAIKKDLGGEEAMMQALGITRNYHSELRRSLNVHRHAQLPDKEDRPPLDRQECFERSKQIVRKYAAHCQCFAANRA